MIPEILNDALTCIFVGCMLGFIAAVGHITYKDWRNNK